MLEFIRSDLAQLAAYNTQHVDALSESGTSLQSGQLLSLDRLNANENPYDLPDDLKQKLAGLWQQAIESNRYPEGNYAALKQSIAQYVSESASTDVPVTVEPDQISVGNGSDELIRSILIATCLGGAGGILVAEPTFSMYAILAQTLGIRVTTIGRSADSFAIDLTAAQAALTNPDVPVRVVFVVHPNSPTGNALSPDEVDWLRSLPENILVVIDEAYFEFSQATLVSALSTHPNWLIMRTFSKAFRLAAHRVGYAIAHPEVIATLEKIRLPYNLPSFSIAAAQIALAERATLLAVVPELLAERTQLVKQLQTFSSLRVWPSAANFVYVDLQTQEPDSEAILASLCHQLQQQGTQIRQTGGGLRITVGTPAENQRTYDRLTQIIGS